MNNVHDKVFTCPCCHNKALVVINPHPVLGVAHGDQGICEECATEFTAKANHDMTVSFERV